MKRTANPEKPTAILAADFHIRESAPICRTDDFWAAQDGKVKFISDLQQKYGCPVLFAGDLYEHWKPSPYLLTYGMQHFPDKMKCVFGNHDLPSHSLDEADRCGMHTLLTAEKIEILHDCHWGMEPQDGSLFFPGHDITVLIWHVMTFPTGKPPWPGCVDLSAGQILDKYPSHPLIVCGHNHKTFVEEKDGRLLVNPGSLMRQDADQIDHKPCVFLWYAKDNRVERVEIPHARDVISREHIDKPKEREERLKAYIENMNMDWESTLLFKANLERHFSENKSIPKLVRDLIWKSTEK